MLALLVSGALDPNTSEQWGDEAARYLTRATLVVILKLSHSFSSVSEFGTRAGRRHRSDARWSGCLQEVFTRRSTDRVFIFFTLQKPARAEKPAKTLAISRALSLDPGQRKHFVRSLDRLLFKFTD